MTDTTRRSGLVVLLLTGSLLLAACGTGPSTAPVEDRRAPMARPVLDPNTTAVKQPPGFENAGKPGYYTVKPGETLIRIGLATLLTMFVGTAILVHQVPILVASGLSRSEAALLASFPGFAAVLGQISSGWMTDRWNAGLIATLTLLAPAIGYGLLLGREGNWMFAFVAMLIIGYSTGAKYQICAFLTGQYAGMRNFGKIFGAMTSMIGIGGGLAALQVFTKTFLQQSVFVLQQLKVGQIP